MRSLVLSENQQNNLRMLQRSLSRLINYAKIPKGNFGVFGGINTETAKTGSKNHGAGGMLMGARGVEPLTC